MREATECAFEMTEKQSILHARVILDRHCILSRCAGRWILLGRDTGMWASATPVGDLKEASGFSVTMAPSLQGFGVCNQWNEHLFLSQIYLYYLTSKQIKLKEFKTNKKKELW